MSFQIGAGGKLYFIVFGQMQDQRHTNAISTNSMANNYLLFYHVYITAAAEVGEVISECEIRCSRCRSIKQLRNDGSAEFRIKHFRKCECLQIK